MSGDISLPIHAGAVVIGGGAMGCSALYHLAKLGISDCVLLERNQLTSGTTWHSAAQVRQLRSTRNMTRLVQYAVPLGDEPVYVKRTFAGQATSAAFGYRIGRPVVLAYLDASIVPEPDGARVELDIAGDSAAGTAMLQAVFDPRGERMRLTGGA